MRPVTLAFALLACAPSPVPWPDDPPPDVAADSGRSEAEVWPEVAIEPPPPPDAPWEAEAPAPDAEPPPDIAADVTAEDAAGEDAARDTAAEGDAAESGEDASAPDVADEPAAIEPPPDAARDAAPDALVPTCSAGRADCNGLASDGCEAILTNRLSCGACGIVCPRRCTLFPPSTYVCG